MDPICAAVDTVLHRRLGLSDSLVEDITSLKERSSMDLSQIMNYLYDKNLHQMKLLMNAIEDNSIFVHDLISSVHFHELLSKCNELLLFTLYILQYLLAI